jgi:hypothetical protein
MKFNQPLYYCTECKLISKQLGDLLFVEDNSSKGFCSKECIEDFYFPIMRHYEKLEANLRSRLLLQNENITSIENELELVNEVLANPSEVWSVHNELEEKIFTYTKHFKDFTSVVICTVYNGQGAFVFLNTKTRSVEFLKELRSNPQEELSQIHADNLNDFSFNEEDYNFMQLLEVKKSRILAELLMKRKESDISFEKFNDYEFCFQECLDFPDEVFKSKDNEGDYLYIYIKSFIKETANFFYIISCLKRKESDDDRSTSVFPILAFPTNDVELYSEWRTGKKITGLIKN